MVIKILREAFDLIIFLLTWMKNKRGNLKRIDNNDGVINIVADGQTVDFCEAHELDHDMVMNFFAKNDKFNIIQPEYYCLLDNMFFEHSFRYSDVIELYNIISRVQWDMTIIIPANRYKDFIRFSPEFPHNITIQKIDTTVYCGALRNLFYDWKMAIPPSPSVIIMAIMAALRLGYDDIRLYGVDHNFFDGIKVSDGALFIDDKHLYGEHKSRLMEDTRIGGYVRIADYVTEKGLVFKSHDIISNYAHRSGVAIGNYTKGSLIQSYLDYSQ